MDKLIETIKKIYENPRGKAVLFFAFYVVFFAIVFLFINLSKTELSYGDDYEKSEVSYTFDLNKLFAENYGFKYNITLDNNNYSYFGAKLKEEETLKYNNLDYYRNGNDYYVKNNELWIKTDNPYVYSEYMDNTNIKKMLEKSSFVSKTVYESGKNTFTFAISTNTLNSILYGLNTDFDEIPNEIIISTDEERNVNHITFNLDSFCKNNNLCVYGFKISLDFDNFGDVEDIINPME